MVRLRFIESRLMDFLFPRLRLPTHNSNNSFRQPDMSPPLNGWAVLLSLTLLSKGLARITFILYRASPGGLQFKELIGNIPMVPLLRYMARKTIQSYTYPGSMRWPIVIGPEQGYRRRRSGSMQPEEG